MLDNGSFQPIPGPAAETASASGARELRRQASNVLMVAGKRSRSGHPLFVGGPQIGYFYPGLTLEMDLHGPGWTARGATSAPFPGYILIGRREDFAWTLTSAGADIVDIYVETLCEGSDTKYLYKGKCRDDDALQRGHARRPGGRRFNRTVHGPVVGYATVDGRRVAVSRKRSSYLLDGVDLLLFQRLTRGKVRNARDVHRRGGDLAADVQHVLRRPRRGRACSPPAACRCGPRASTPGLPTDGRGGYEWRGFLKPKDAPAGDPARRRAEQLEQQARARLPRRRRPVVLRVDQPRRPAQPEHQQARRSTRWRR